MTTSDLHVSVILPVYNGGAYLKEAIESIFKQTFSDFEIIIIDDGSTDGSERVIRSFNDSRIRRLKHDKNLGVAKTLIEAMSLARGKYIIRMDADDVSLPQRIGKQVRFMDENPQISLAGSWVRCFGTKTMDLRFPTSIPAVESALLHENPIAASSLIIRAEDLRSTGISYAERYRYENDYSFYVRAVMAGLKVANVPEVLLEKRSHAEQMSNFFEGRVKAVEDMEIQKGYFAFLVKRRRFLDPRYLPCMLRFAYLRVAQKLSYTYKKFDLKRRERNFYRIPFEKCYHAGCSDEGLKDTDVLDIATVAFNNAEVIDWQIRLIRKYLKDPYIYTVFDNSSDVRRSDEIRKVCANLDAAYVRMPENPLTRSSSHGAALNWIYRHYTSKRAAKYFGFIDHDIFPNKETGVIDILKAQPVYGYLQERSHLWYVWAGFCFFRSDFIDRGADFQDGVVEGVSLDTGGMNWTPVYSRIDRQKISFPSSWYEEIRKPKNPTQKLVDKSLDHVEHIGDWVHVFSSSGWKKMRDQDERDEKVRHIISGLL